MKSKTSQFCIMLGFMMGACFLGISGIVSARIAGVNCWMVPIFGTIIGFPLLLIYLYIFNAKKDKNINSLNIYLFGNKFGKIINVLLLIGVISFNIISFWNLTSFVSSQYLYNTPQWFITLLFTLTMIYFLKQGPRVMLRATMMLFYISIFLYIISGLGLTFQMKMDNLKPILEHGITPVFKGVYNYIAYTIFPIFIMLIISKDKIEQKKLNKWIIITYFITNLLIFIVAFYVIGVFGINLATLYQYPAYHILKRVFVGGFIERMENTLSIQWIINLFIPCAFSFYYTMISVKENFKIKNKVIPYLAIIAVIILSNFVIKNNTIGENILLKIYPLILGIFFLIIPIIIATFIWYKKKIHKVSFK